IPPGQRLAASDAAALPTALPAVVAAGLPAGLPRRGDVRAYGRSRASARVRTGLLDQPLEPFHPLPDVIDRARVRPLVGKLVLYRAGEQLAHAVGGGWLVSAKQDVVSQ